MTAREEIDKYISGFTGTTRSMLESLRETIRQAAPGAEELVSYQMPAFKQKKIIVWYAGYRNHIGLYPKGSAIEVFKSRLTGYECSKGTIRFPIDKPLPLELVTDIVRYRVAENLR